MNRDIPDIGDVVWINLEPVVGHEQGGKYPRPVIVMTPAAHNGPSHRIVGVPCTTKNRGFATEIPIESLAKPCVALIDQMTTLDWVERKASLRGERISEAELDAVRRSLKVFLNL
ncbi:toxin [Paraburkholderia sp. Ac-20340]|uniref:type II toxin-antitoxin system PemK/MazF family toxin n=1 Tax=Paraburkholderia sp. Ac-20340 TaxID=2703888 RepID=UPI00197F462B|nr:type II toxin-antitoxin system PemK/MazF family toxin [Paraburkholderia sp. Ac-20340]MBN3855464.1 toxin [Paraburkholderia sp. Ac-20340]